MTLSSRRTRISSSKICLPWATNRTNIPATCSPIVSQIRARRWLPQDRATPSITALQVQIQIRARASVPVQARRGRNRPSHLVLPSVIRITISRWSSSTRRLPSRWPSRSNSSKPIYNSKMAKSVGSATNLSSNSTISNSSSSNRSSPRIISR